MYIIGLQRRLLLCITNILPSQALLLDKDYGVTFSCCCSSLFSLAKTVLVSLLRLIDAWIAFLSFPTDLRIY